jgi:GMP synthase (glutamine-hydrolysing)
MTPPHLLIIKTGASLQAAHQAHGDFDQWFMRHLDPLGVVCSVVEVHQGETLPAVSVACATWDAALITGSAAMVSHRHDWSETSAQWLAQAHTEGLAMLGVCYGHQLLAHALGGVVGPNPSGRRMGSYAVDIVAADDPLLGPMAPQQWFQASHVERVLTPPPQARIVARVDGDPHHALHFGGRCWGVQFHPEFDEAIMRCYIDARQDVLRGEGMFPEALRADLRTTPAGPLLLHRFIELACSQRSIPLMQAIES